MSSNDRRFGAFIIKFLFLTVAPFLAWGYGTQAMSSLQQLSLSTSATRGFVIGGALFTPLWFLAKKYAWGPLQFICTLEHELTHGVVGLPFLLFPKRLRVTAMAGGHIEQIWRGPRWLIALYAPGRVLSGLAPYFLPTISYVIIAFAFLFDMRKLFAISLALGFVTAFHVVSSWSETRYRQPDIQQAGPIFCTLVLPIANLIAFGAIVSFLATGPKGFVQYWTQGVSYALTSFSALVNQLYHLILSN